MTAFEFVGADLAATDRFAAALADLVVGASVRAPTGLPGLVVGLSGPLGAGKTTLVQGVVAALSPDRDLYVTSPTYAIVHTYETTPPVSHLDLYRLDSLEELEAIGYRDLYYGPGAAFVEWIERIPEAIPEQWLEVRLRLDAASGPGRGTALGAPVAPAGGQGRRISVQAHGEALSALTRAAFEGSSLAGHLIFDE